MGYTRKLNQAPSASTISRAKEGARPKSGNAGEDLEHVVQQSPDVKSNEKSRDRRRNSHSASMLSAASILSKDKALSSVDPRFVALHPKIVEESKEKRDAQVGDTPDE